MRESRRWLVLCAGALAACGSSGPEQVCMDGAGAACAKLQMCSAFLLQAVYGDMVTCQARLALACTPILSAPGSATSPAKLESCAQAVMAESCTSLEMRDLPASCMVDPGMVANGAACGTDGQCQSGFCQTTAGNCGTCGPRPALGGACGRDDDCPPLQKCQIGRCAMYGGMGASCDNMHPCTPTLACRGGTCMTAGAAGASCTPRSDGDDCDATQGLFCNVVSRVCQAIMLVPAGQPCGFINGGLVGCQASGQCRTNGGPSGTCVLTVMDGAACNTFQKMGCLPPATCTGGICKLPVDPATCH